MVDKIELLIGLKNHVTKSPTENIQEKSNMNNSTKLKKLPWLDVSILKPDENKKTEKEHGVLRCEFCGKKYSNPKFLRIHIYRVHEKNNIDSDAITLPEIDQSDENIDYENQIQEHLIKGHSVFGNF